MNRRDLLKATPALTAMRAPASPAARSGARLRPALCAYSFRQALAKKSMSYQDLLRVAADAGADGIDMTVYWFPDTSGGFLLPLKRLAYKLSVEIYSIAVRTEMTQRTPELQQKEVAKVRKWVEVAERLGAGHIRVFGGKIPQEATEEQAAGWVVEVLKRAADFAGSKGIILGIENHGGITEKAATIVDIVKRVDSPWVGVNLDSGNFTTDVYSQIEKCVPYAVNFQMKTEIREGGERKHCDWDRVLTIAADSGYRGYLALEYEAAEPAETAVPLLMDRLGQMCRKYSIS
jgi:L-ribulose-5-phosphate 3-epimerase